uniref:Uncharacterized protein n=1 Tax=Octopus bimaculoides TaxID=37653 RepID=A0A0L8HYL7_OCTBM
MEHFAERPKHHLTDDSNLGQSIEEVCERSVLTFQFFSHNASPARIAGNASNESRFKLRTQKCFQKHIHIHTFTQTHSHKHIHTHTMTHSHKHIHTHAFTQHTRKISGSIKQATRAFCDIKK